MRYFLHLIYLVIIFSNSLFPQDIRIGSPLDNRYNPQGGFYDYSDPRYVNIMVNIWGYVRFPGKYYVPENSRVLDLLSYAGGPTPDAFLNDIRIYRSSTQEESMIKKLNFDDIMNKENPDVKNLDIPLLTPGDIILVPGEPKLYFRDYVSIYTSITSVLISLTILILNIVK
jgi:polysaccharide export outer membrane protein